MKKRHINLEDILADRVVEEDLLEVPFGDRVLRLFFIIGFCILILVAVEVVYIGIFQHAFYANRAVANMSDVKIQAAPRGMIIDRFGKPLVENEPGFNVFLIPRELPESSGGRAEAVKGIADLLGVDEADLLQRLLQKDWSVSDKLFLTNDLSQEKLVDIAAQHIAGIQIVPTFKRMHTVPLAFSQLIGYTGFADAGDLRAQKELSPEDEIGKSGLEAYYDGYLRGINGEDVLVKNARGEVQNERMIKISEPGKKLTTFIDRDFQEYFYTRLTEALRMLGRQVAVGIALNPQNGEVLALVNIPGFETSGIAKALTDPNKPLFNRAVSGLYNPGSTIKPLVATAALTENVIDPETKILSTGSIQVPNPYDPERPSTFLDWRPQGWVDLRAALARSSNVYFYEVGGGFENQKGLGITKLNEWWSKFGLDKLTEIDITSEKSGFLPTPEWKQVKTKEPWRLGDTYNVSIGQGDLLITPIELLNYIAAIANGGTFYKPRIVNAIFDTKNAFVYQSSKTVLTDLRKEVAGHIAEVEAGMRDGVTETYGTSYLLHDLPVAVAAKTGTAQIQNNAKTNAFFVGYAPFNNPQLAILILIENSREGSLNTIPVAYDVFLWYYNNRLLSAGNKTQ